MVLPSTPPPRRRHRGMSLGHIFGIQIQLDPSVLIVFALVVYSLGASLFPRWHPSWDAALVWGSALAAGFIFFASLLAHELSHSVVAKLRGIAVPRITLFVFGGVSELEREPDTPATEFLIAIVGPAMSALLGVAFIWIGTAVAGLGFTDQVLRDPGEAMAHLGPAATLFLWLGPMNLMLAFFNLVPGFPLDGGRVLRAMLWGMFGDLQRATLWASNTGRAFAWALMGVGVLQGLGGALMQGVWLLVIGWFLNNAARNSYTQLLVQQALDELVVGNLMRTHFEVVRPDLPLEAFINDLLLRSAQSVWPVVEDRKAVGLISFDDARASNEAERVHQTVRDVMKPIDDRVRPDLGGRDALRILAESDTDPLPVMQGEQIVGLLHGSDIARWLALHHLEG